MFRDLYKQANDDIKGDRAILDKAFLQASQPVKKTSPVIKYSFVGTAVAAVVLIGAVFANPQVFTEKTANIGKSSDSVTRKEYNEVATEEETYLPGDVIIAEDTASGAAVVPEDKPHASVKSVQDNKAEKENNPEQSHTAVHEDAPTLENDAEDKAVSENGEEALAEGDYNYTIAVTSLSEEDYEEPASEEPMLFNWGRDRATGSSAEAETDELYNKACEEDGEPETENSAESATEAAYEAATEAEQTELFSYMEHVSRYDGEAPGVKTEGFVNTSISPIASAQEAISLAEGECTIEYDTAKVYYDPVERMWLVVFYAKDIPGGCQSIYITPEGITTLIVYGE